MEVTTKKVTMVQFAVRQGTIINIEGIPCTLLNEALLETHEGNHSIIVEQLNKPAITGVKEAVKSTEDFTEAVHKLKSE